MPVFLISLFSAVIIFMTVYFMIKALKIANKREEISVFKYRVFATSSIILGILIAFVLPFVYQRLFDIIL